MQAVRAKGGCQERTKTFLRAAFFAGIFFVIFTKVFHWDEKTSLAPSLVLFLIFWFVVVPLLERRERKRLAWEQAVQREREKIRRRELAAQARKHVLKKDYGIDFSSKRNSGRQIPPEIMEAVFQRDNGRCVLCGSEEEV